MLDQRKRLVGKRMERIYYHIEPIGKKYLKELTANYNHLHKAVHSILYRTSQETEVTQQA